MICNLFSLIFFSATARSFILYSDRPVVTSKSSSTFATNDSENKVINDDDDENEIDATKKSADGESRGNRRPDEIIKSTFTSDETTTTTSKSAYHSFYVYPRPQGSVQHSPNLLWHEVNFQNRGRSLSPSVNKIRTELGTRECQR